MTNMPLEKEATMSPACDEPTPPEPRLVVSTRDVGVTYGSNQALSGVSLDFQAGQVSALIGPSGCGKSTFLRCLDLMNAEIPHCRVQGSIAYHGRDICDGTCDVFQLRKGIGMIFQQPNPFAKSIYDNIALALRRHGMRDRAQLDAVVESSLRAAALWDEVKGKLGTSALSLSGGQQQRLCIARSLALSPDVLLMDEPCSALDPLATAAIEQTVGSLAQTGMCVIMVTHNIEQAARISDQTAFFLMGEVVESGLTKSVFEQPTDKRTEDYLSGRFG